MIYPSLPPAFSTRPARLSTAITTVSQGVTLSPTSANAPSSSDELTNSDKCSYCIGPPNTRWKSGLGPRSSNKPSFSRSSMTFQRSDSRPSTVAIGITSALAPRAPDSKGSSFGPEVVCFLCLQRSSRRNSISFCACSFSPSRPAFTRDSLACPSAPAMSGFARTLLPTNLSKLTVAKFRTASTKRFDKSSISLRWRSSSERIATISSAAILASKPLASNRWLRAIRGRELHVFKTRLELFKARRAKALSPIARI